jgi:hypothetical protein
MTKYFWIGGLGRDRLMIDCDDKGGGVNVRGMEKDTKSKVAGEEREERERRTLDQEIGNWTRAEPWKDDTERITFPTWDFYEGDILRSVGISIKYASISFGSIK